MVYKHTLDIKNPKFLKDSERLAYLIEPFLIKTHCHPVILHIPTLERRKFKISQQVFTPPLKRKPPLKSS
jgi:hypothetical protein